MTVRELRGIFQADVLEVVLARASDDYFRQAHNALAAPTCRPAYRA